MKEKILNISEVSPGDPVSKYHLLQHGKKEQRRGLDHRGGHDYHRTQLRLKSPLKHPVKYMKEIKYYEHQ